MNLMGYEFMKTRGGRVEVSIGENMMRVRISVLAVGYVRWTGGISVPVTNSMKREFFVNEQNLLAPVDGERAGVEMFNGRQPRALGGSVDRWYRDGHCARLLRLLGIPPGHIVMSSFVCALSDLRLICVTTSLAQVKSIIASSQSIMGCEKCHTS